MLEEVQFSILGGTVGTHLTHLNLQLRYSEAFSSFKLFTVATVHDGVASRDCVSS